MSHVWTEADVIAYMVRRGLPLDATLTVPTRPAPEAMPEDAFLAEVRRLAKAHGYLVYHTYDARRSEAGFPDLVLARPATATSEARLIFAELKSRQGKISQEQHLWLDVLAHTIPGIEVYVWHPSDLNNIVQILTRK